MAKLKWLAVLAVLVLMPLSAYAKEFGLVFEIEGDVWVEGAQGKVKLSPKKDLLRAVEEGDKVNVGKGRILIVSSKDSKGYELASNTSASVGSGALKASKGKIKEKKGGLPLVAPTREKHKLGAMIMRSAPPCITLKTPKNTALLDLTPTLRWESCQQSGNFKVAVVEDGLFVYAANSPCCEVRVPEGKLNSGSKYEWHVESGDNISTVGTFYIPDEAKLAELRRDMESYKAKLKEEADLPTRLSYVSYLINNELAMDADEELTALEKEYPDNEFIKEFRTW